MIGHAAARLAQHQIEPQNALAAGANYAPARISGGQVFVSGELPVGNGEFRCVGSQAEGG